MFTLVTNSLTNSLTHSLLFSKLVNVVTVAYEDRVGNNLLQISKLRFGQKTKIWFRAQGLVKILKLKFRQDLQLKFGQFFLLMFC